jgi:hypothetical protein
MGLYSPILSRVTMSAVHNTGRTTTATADKTQSYIASPPLKKVLLYGVARDCYTTTQTHTSFGLPPKCNRADYALPACGGTTFLRVLCRFILPTSFRARAECLLASPGDANSTLGEPHCDIA